MSEGGGVGAESEREREGEASHMFSLSTLNCCVLGDWWEKFRELN